MSTEQQGQVKTVLLENRLFPPAPISLPRRRSPRCSSMKRSIVIRSRTTKPFGKRRAAISFLDDTVPQGIEWQEPFAEWFVVARRTLLTIAWMHTSKLGVGIGLLSFGKGTGRHSSSHLSRYASRSLPICQRIEEARCWTRRRRQHLYAHGARIGHRDCWHALG